MIAIAGIGLTTVIEGMGHWFEWVRLIGAAYLIWMGWQMIRSSGRIEAGETPVIPRGGFFLQGLLVAVSNPKTLIFFGAFFPQFIDPAGDYTLQITVMGLTALIFAAISDSAYAVVGGTGRAHAIGEPRAASVAHQRQFPDRRRALARLFTREVSDSPCSRKGRRARGKIAGGARETAPRTKLRGSVLCPLPTCQKWPDANSTRGDGEVRAKSPSPPRCARHLSPTS